MIAREYLGVARMCCSGRMYVWKEVICIFFHNDTPALVEVAVPGAMKLVVSNKGV